MDSVERAEFDLAEARIEAERLKDQAAAASERVRKLENFLEMARVYLVKDRPKAGPIASSRPPSGGKILTQAVIEIIRERGARQQTRHLLVELERRGHHVGGENKTTNLSGTLSRAPELTSSRTEGWGLKEWEAPDESVEMGKRPTITIGDDVIY